MSKKVIVTADDFGLTRSATDTVLQCFDNGSLTRVSIIPNGYAVEYALGEWQKRSGRLSLSIHLNLTEGKALSKPKDIPHLVDSRGNFKHSPFSLLVRTFFALPNKRRLIATEIKNELTAQIQRIRAHVSNASIGIDGHQHVHVIPIVFSEIFQLHKQYGFELIRLPYEPFFWATTSLRAYSVFGLGRHFVLNFFSRIIAKKYIKNNLPRTDFFIGTLMSGHANFDSVASALGEVERRGGDSVEIGFHPGCAGEGELTEWRGDVAWHYSLWRTYEKDLLQNSKFAVLLGSFLSDTFSYARSRTLEILRFIVAGGIATGTNLGFLYILTRFFGFWYIFSAVIAYLVATLVSFTLQKFWTFSHRSLDRVNKEFAWYVLNNILCIAFDIVGLYILVEYFGMWYMFAQFILLALIALWNFFVFRFFIFRE